MYVDLKTVKKHLQIDEDYLDDDAYLLMLISVAEDSVATHLDLDLKEVAIETAMETAYANVARVATPEVTSIIIAGKKKLKEVDSSLIETQSSESDNNVTTCILPPAIQHAILLMIGNLYNNREPVSYNTVVAVPYTLDYLLGLYKNYK